MRGDAVNTARCMKDSANSPLLFAPKWALGLGLALVAVIALVTVLARIDRLRRERLETTSETTAVGDARYFQPALDPKELSVAGATLNGQPLIVAWGEKIDVRDTHLRRVAVDAASGLTIYELAEAATGEERERVAKAGGGYLLKLSPDDYVSARPAKP